MAEVLLVMKAISTLMTTLINSKENSRDFGKVICTLPLIFV